FTEQTRIGVGDRSVRVVLAVLAVKIPLAIAPAIPWRAMSRWRLLVAIVFRHEALHARPCLDQGAVNREVVARKERAHLGLLERGGKELPGNVAIDEAITVLTKHGG